MRCVGEFDVGLRRCICAVCGAVVSGFGGVRVCCVWESLVWDWGSECMLDVGEFDVGLRKCVCAVCGKVLSGFGGVNVCCVGQFVVGLWE